MSRSIKPTVDCVVDIRSINGEGPIWSVREQVLYWVDVPERLLYQYNPSSGENRQWKMPEQIGCCACIKDGGVMVALANGFYRFDPITEALTPVGDLSPLEFGHRFSEGTVDPAGRFLAGTSPYVCPTAEDSTGRVFSLDGKGNIQEVLRGFHTINGMAFSPDGTTAYASDSFPSVRRIWAWDYDPLEGSWRNKRLFFDTTGRPGRPDGAAVDVDGCYWSAGVGGWQLIRLTPQGVVDRVVEVPVERPSKIAFGGSDLSTIYFTSLSFDLSQGRDQPQAGGVFALTLPSVSGIAIPELS